MNSVERKPVQSLLFTQKQIKLCSVELDSRSFVPCNRAYASNLDIS